MRGATTLLLAAVLAAPAAQAAKRPPAFTFGLSKAGDQLVLKAPGYRLALDRVTGAIVGLTARPSGARLVSGESGCLWSAETSADADVDGCPDSAVAYRWSRPTRTLTLKYPSATVALVAGASSLDLSLTLDNQTGSTLQSVRFPADLLETSATVKAGYVPTYLPGLRLKPAFFWGGVGAVWTYPSRWAFADYLAYDAGASSLALYSVNPPPAPMRPVDIGFDRTKDGGCSGPTFCVRHQFDTWIDAGKTWTSPPVRLQIGMTAQQSILAYRHDNAIDAYPSVAAKVGAALPALEQAPLIKADLKNGVPFARWASELSRLTSPVLLHPVSFQPGPFDSTDPDFLPPDPALGSTADFRAAVDQAHALGHLVMPYLNASWWSVQSPTIGALAAPLGVDDVSVQNRLGEARVEDYGDRSGYVVSPFVPYVRQRFADLLSQWQTDVPADCLFFDQLGARPWLRDFNPAAPDPLSYEDGWLSLLAPGASRCLMVEDGFDRLAAVSSGFLGGLLLMEREFQEPDARYGAGNWEPYPLALWLLHDKVLLYQHDLYDGAMTTDLQALEWNLAFGFLLSFDWNAQTDSLASPWLDVAASFQHALGPLYAAQPLTSFTTVAPGVTRTSFGGYSVTANWSATDPYDTDEDELAPGGFVATTDDGRIRAGVFGSFFGGAPLSGGVHYLVVERTPSSVTVHQPLGDATELAVDLPASWRPGSAPTAKASTADGAAGAVVGRIEGRRFVFQCLGPADGQPAPTYVISAGSR